MTSEFCFGNTSRRAIVANRMFQPEFSVIIIAMGHNANGNHEEYSSLLFCLLAAIFSEGFYLVQFIWNSKYLPLLK